MTYTITKLEGNESAPLRKKYALDPLTHPDVLEIIAKYDIDLSVSECIIENPKAPEHLKQIVLERRKSVLGERFGYEEKFTKNGCPLLWNHISTFANGDIRMCCEMVGEETGYGKIYDKDNKSINVHDHRLSDARNSSKSKLLRKVMMAGGKPKECQQCYHREELGMDSKRTGSLTKYSGEISNLLQNTTEDGTIDTNKIPLQDLDLRFGNTCNLKCRSCGPQDSNLWYEDYFKLNKGSEEKKLNLWFYGETKYKLIETQKGVDINTDRFVWLDTSLFYNDILDSMPNVKTIYFTGGEPTVIKKHKQLLEYCIEKGFAKNIILDYNTNLHATPTYLSKYWIKFRHVNIGASIDAHGDTQAYMRPPSTWEGIKNNLIKLNDLKCKHIEVRLSPTFSIMNIANMTKLADWLIDQNFEYIKNVMGNHTLYYPEEYSVQVLPLDVKLQIKKNYEYWLQNLKDTDNHKLYKHYKECFAPVIKFMLEKDKSNLLKEFIRKTEKLDKIRNEDWKTGLSDLYNILKEHGYV